MAIPIAYNWHSTNRAGLLGLRDLETGAYINDATVQARLLHEDGTEVPGVTWPVTLAYVTASNGEYRGAIHWSAQPRLGKFVLYEVSALTSGDVKRTWLYRLNVIGT